MFEFRNNFFFSFFLFSLLVFSIHGIRHFSGRELRQLGDGGNIDVVVVVVGRLEEKFKFGSWALNMSRLFCLHFQWISELVLSPIIIKFNEERARNGSEPESRLEQFHELLFLWVVTLLFLPDLIITLVGIECWVISTWISLSSNYS